MGGLAIAAALTDAQRSAILDFMLGRSTKDALVAALGVDPDVDRHFVLRVLEHARATRSAEDVEFIMMVASAFQLSPEWAPILASLIKEPWHTRHEDLADALQDLRDPSTVDALYEASRAHHPYLDYDDTHALARRCSWALHDIGTPSARSYLAQLSASPIPAVQDCAQELVEDLSSRAPDEPPEPYRIERDKNVRGR